MHDIASKYSRFREKAYIPSEEEKNEIQYIAATIADDYIRDTVKRMVATMYKIEDERAEDTRVGNRVTTVKNRERGRKMIKMDYGDATHKCELIDKYPKIFQSATLAEKEAEWTRLRNKLINNPFSLSKAVLPMTFKEILVADFDVLFAIYQAYKAKFIPSNKKKRDYKRVDHKLKMLFNYTSCTYTASGKKVQKTKEGKQDSIARFFMNN